MNYDQLGEHDAAMASKDEEIEQLKARIAEPEVQHNGGKPQGALLPRTGDSLHTNVHERETPPVHEGHPPATSSAVRLPSTQEKRRKAPPVDAFTGEKFETQLDDWLPSLERAATWNGWSDEDRLLQLAGYLRGRALQEWNLLDRSTYSHAVEALHARLDPVSKTMAV